MSESFSITREESEQIQKEQDIIWCVHYLQKALGFLDFEDVKISEAIEKLKTMSRFGVPNYEFKPYWKEKNT